MFESGPRGRSTKVGVSFSAGSDASMKTWKSTSQHSSRLRCVANHNKHQSGAEMATLVWYNHTSTSELDPSGFILRGSWATGRIRHFSDIIIFHKWASSYYCMSIIVHSYILLQSLHIELSNDTDLLKEQGFLITKQKTYNRPSHRMVSCLLKAQNNIIVLFTESSADLCNTQAQIHWESRKAWLHYPMLGFSIEITWSLQVLCLTMQPH